MQAKAVILTGLILGLFGLATPWHAYADYPPFTRNNPQTNHETPPREPSENTSAVGGAFSGRGQNGAGESSKPQPANVATKLIGMKVINPANERLGTVKDVVLDLQTGHVSYVVVEKASPAGGTGEFTAVRPTSLMPSSDPMSLILDVDKDSFEQARGFSPANYPRIRNSAYGTQSMQGDIFGGNS